MQKIYISLGTSHQRGKIFPIFIPFLGCPFRCIFCSQEKQTGTQNKALVQILDEKKQDFLQFIENTKEKIIDIAFYGGTFTALSKQDFFHCLDFFLFCKENAYKKNIFLQGRCSTRPDCLNNNQALILLKEYGINLIELGIQSFNNNVLLASKRGYDTQIAQKACEDILTSGYELGIQLMAGLPNQTTNIFLNDVQKALSLKPHCLRYYPCLVPQGTKLAELYLQGKYQTWNYEQTVDTLGEALALAWQKRIPVIRLSVAPEQEFDKMILAGVRSPSLGSAIMGKALLLSTQKKINSFNYEKKILFLNVPKKTQGFLFGERNILKSEWEKILPLTHINYINQTTSDNYAELIFVNKD